MRKLLNAPRTFIAQDGHLRFRLSSSFHVEMCYSGVANGTLPSRHIGGLLSGDDLVPEGLAVT